MPGMYRLAVRDDAQDDDVWEADLQCSRWTIGEYPVGRVVYHIVGCDSRTSRSRQVDAVREDCAQELGQDGPHVHNLLRHAGVWRLQLLAPEELQSKITLVL